MVKINKKLRDKEEREKEIIEDKIIDWIAKAAAGQLTVFKVKTNLGETEVVVKKRGEYEGKAISVKIYGRQSLDKGSIFAKEIIQKGFEPNENLYLIFVYFDIVEQDISDFIWIVPSLKFRDLADSIALSDGTPILRFEASLDPKKKNRYTKFLINKKDLATILAKIAETEKFEFPEVGLGEIRIINLEELKKFIIEARKNTYAGNGPPIDNPRLRGSTQLEHQKGDYFYQDIYFSGEKNFIGQEIVYRDNRPIWGTGYLGETPVKEIEDFLKESLLKLSDECRFGNECEFKKREFLYKDRGEGNLERFSGQEKIFIKDKEIYKLNYYGGLISK